MCELRVVVACLVLASAAGCASSQLFSRATITPPFSVEMGVSDGAGGFRREAHQYSVCDSRTVAPGAALRCPLHYSRPAEDPATHVAEGGLTQLSAPYDVWCVVLDEDFGHCRPLADLGRVARAIVEHQEAQRVAAAEAQARADAEAARQRLEVERAEARRAITTATTGCSVVGSGAFVADAEQPQRLWLCSSDAALRALVEDGARVLRTQAVLEDEVDMSTAQVVASHLVDVTSSEPPDLLVEVTDDCGNSTIALLSWHGASLGASWLQSLDGDACGSGDDGICYDDLFCSVYAAPWWPTEPAGPREPLFTLVNGVVMWRDQPARWDAASASFVASARARDAWYAQLDEEASRLAGDGRGVEATRSLRPGAPAELRAQVATACEQSHLTALRTLATTTSVVGSDAEGEETRVSIGDSDRVRLRVQLATQGLGAHCAPESMALLAALRSAQSDLVLELARAGQPYDAELAAITDTGERARVGARASTLAARQARDAAAAAAAALRAEQRALTPATVIVGSWIDRDSHMRESYMRGGRCRIGSGYLTCRYRFLGGPTFHDDGSTTQVMRLTLGRMSAVYQVTTLVAAGRTAIGTESESGSRQVLQRVGE
jgi:hypothetical protein